MICRNNPTFVEFVSQVSETLMEAQEHQDLPFDQLIDQLRIKRTLSYNSLLQIMFDFEYLSTSPLNDFRLSEQLQLSIAPLVRRTCVFDFSLTVREEYSNNREDICQQLSLELEYNIELYAELTVSDIGNHLINLLQSIVVNSEESIRQFSIISKEEIENVETKDQLISPPSGSMLLIHEMFEQEANIRPHACAVSYLHQTISYGQLNELSHRMAKYLVQCGVQKETIVAVCLDRSINLISVILAVLKAGGAFLPIDCQIPPARMQAILIHSRCRFVIAERKFFQFLDLIIDGNKVTLVEMETFEAQMHLIENGDYNLPTIEDHNLAYVIYTSGSTGVPKGVMIEHKNIRSIAHAWKRIYKLSAKMHHLQMANVAFDVFIGDVVRALSFGARLVLCPREILMQPNDLLALIERESITCAEFVPVILRAIFENTTFLERKNRLKSLSLLICGSEKWLSNEYENIRQSLRHDARLVSSYGLTEATIDSTYFECKPLQWQDEVFTVPIGIPFPGISVYVLDENLMCVPRGVTGELFIGGPCVARGYLNNQALTDERFIINPFHQIQSTTQHRLYRTGDLVRYLSDGQTLQFVGRLDEQVKIPTEKNFNQYRDYSRFKKLQFRTVIMHRESQTFY
jgi:amino acid adenylation domain-containing protein